MSGTKFYTYRQNNSGAYFIENDDVAQYIIIEALDQPQANCFFWKVVKDYSEYCKCCGERWNDYICNVSNKPQIYKECAYKLNNDNSIFTRSTIIYYLNGDKIKLRYDDEDEDNDY